MFTGLKVVELASVLAGPSVGQFFAELGAEVIKVENLRAGGDVTRSWKMAGEAPGDLSAYFCCCNWGKKSVAIDLQTNQGKKSVHRLIKDADLVIASYKPGDAEKLGVNYEQLKPSNPRLIYGQISGYGSANKRVGYDAVIQAEAGFMDLNGELNGEPLKMPVALMDVMAAHHLKEGLLLALLHRERTGLGAKVEVSLIQAAVASLANQATNWLIGGKLPTRSGSAHPNIAPYGDSFITRDGRRIILAVGNDKQFQQLCDYLSIPAVAAAPNFATNEARVQHRTELKERLTKAILSVDSSSLLPSLHRMRIPAGMIQTVAEVFQMPEAMAMQISAGILTSVRNFAATSSAWQTRPMLHPPHLGEHTEEILGYT